MAPPSTRTELTILVATASAEARVELERLAGRHGGRVVASASDAGTAEAALRSSRADVALLEVAVGALALARALPSTGAPLVLLVADDAGDAAEAFEVGAVDYLVRPFDESRFALAFARARERVMLQRIKDQLFVLFRGAPPTDGASSPPEVDGGRGDLVDGPVDRIAVEMRGKVRVVPVDEIDYVTSSGPYAELHAGERRHVIRASMRDLERRLDPARFVRVHRSIIVQVDRIDTLLKGGGGEYEVLLRTGARLRVSRARREMLERRLGVIPARDDGQRPADG